MATDTALKITYQKDEDTRLFPNRYYVHVDGEKIGWVQKTTRLDQMSNRAITGWDGWLKTSEFKGRQVVNNETSRYMAVDSLLIKGNVGTSVQREAWFKTQLSKFYR